jgi:ABC-type glutathione transport system ATPase component
MSVLLQVEGLSKTYVARRDRLWAPPLRTRILEGIDFTIEAGRSFGIVGESGAGKSTLARLILALEPPDQGRVLFDGSDLHRLSRSALRALRPDIQIVFQNPYGSLDPRQRLHRIIAEPLAARADLSRQAWRTRVAETLLSVGLRESDMDKYPHQFSGGQRQRIAIARALVSRPRLVIADEPVSALDVSVQAQVLNLLRDLQDQFKLTYLIISHDLAVVDYMCDTVAVMRHGRIIEQGSPARLFGAAADPYTRALVAAVPQLKGPAPG